MLWTLGSRLEGLCTRQTVQTLLRSDANEITLDDGKYLRQQVNTGVIRVPRHPCVEQRCLRPLGRPVVYLRRMIPYSGPNICSVNKLRAPTEPLVLALPPLFVAIKIE